MSYGDVSIRSNSKYLRIETGTPHDIHLLDKAPKEKIVHGFGKDAVPCEGEGCASCADGNEAKQRFVCNVYDHTLQKVMIWEVGASIMKQLKSIDQALREEGKTITEVDLKVEAEGANMQKKYRVTPRMTAKALPPEAGLPF